MIAAYFALGVALLFVQHSQCLTTENSADEDDYVDNALTKVREMIYDKGLDPYDAIDKTVLGMHIVGSLAGLRSIHRLGDVNQTQTAEALETQAFVRVFDLKAILHWKSTYAFLPTIEGGSTSTIRETVVKMTVRKYNNPTNRTITEFKMDFVGHIHTDLEVHTIIPGLDKLVLHISDSIANALKNVLTKTMEGPIRQVIQTAFDDITAEEH